MGGNWGKYCQCIDLWIPPPCWWRLWINLFKEFPSWHNCACTFCLQIGNAGDRSGSSERTLHSSPFRPEKLVRNNKQNKTWINSEYQDSFFFGSYLSLTLSFFSPILSDHLFKILLVGDSGVGKSSLLLRFTVWRLWLFVLLLTTCVKGWHVSRNIHQYDRCRL